MTKRQKEIQRKFFAKCGPNVAMLAALFDSLPNIAFYIKDADGRIVAINRYNCELCNIPSPAAAIGKRSLDLFPRAYGQRPRRAEQRVRGCSRHQKNRHFHMNAPYL